VKKRDIQLHESVVFFNKEMYGRLWDKDFRNELRRVSSHSDNISLVSIPSEDFTFPVFWHKHDAGNGCVCECGFWKNAWHMDTKGLWDKSQLNNANEAIEKYIPPKNGILDKIRGNRKYEPKTWPYIDHYEKWDGVVLVTQKSRDASVSVVGGKENYYTFLRKACEYYGDTLLLKAHPRHSDDDRQETRAIVKGTGAKYGTLRDLDGCEFALLYNSTISGELFVKNIPIVQYARGYFNGLKAIHFTDGKVEPPPIRDTKEIAEKTAEFLLWKYCIRPFIGKEDVLNFTDMLLEFANSKDAFPLKEQYSYASSLT
jgi:hypothetical protein